MRLVDPLIVAGVLLSVACGGQSPAPATPAKPDAKVDKTEKSDGVVRPITDGQLQVAHYATRDGVLGLVLDRTGEIGRASCRERV